MRKIIKLLCMLFCFLISEVSSSQIRYSEGGLKINSSKTEWSYDYGLTINGWRGMKWTPKPNLFLLFDLYVASPAIAGHGDQIAFYNSETTTFNSILVSNVYQMSDGRAKQNVESLSNCVAELMYLNPVSYTWRKTEANQGNVDNIDVSSNNIPRGSSSDDNLQFGFLAQEVEQIIPEAVKTIDGGYKLINYTALIPMMVEAIQSLQKTVENQAIVISQLKNSTSSKLKSSSSNRILSCTPNPTTGYISISFMLDSDISAPVLRITDLSGNLMRDITVYPNQSSISCDVSNYPNGVYVVGLFADNLLLDTNRIIKQ